VVFRKLGVKEVESERKIKIKNKSLKIARQ